MADHRPGGPSGSPSRPRRPRGGQGGRKKGGRSRGGETRRPVQDVEPSVEHDEEEKKETDEEEPPQDNNLTRACFAPGTAAERESLMRQMLKLGNDGDGREVVSVPPHSPAADEVKEEAPDNNAIVHAMEGRLQAVVAPAASAAAADPLNDNEIEQEPALQLAPAMSQLEATMTGDGPPPTKPKPARSPPGSPSKRHFAAADRARAKAAAKSSQEAASPNLTCANDGPPKGPGGSPRRTPKKWQSASPKTGGMHSPGVAFPPLDGRGRRSPRRAKAKGGPKGHSREMPPAERGAGTQKENVGNRGEEGPKAEPKAPASPRKEPRETRGGGFVGPTVGIEPGARDDASSDESVSSYEYSSDESSTSSPSKQTVATERGELEGFEEAAVVELVGPEAARAGARDASTKDTPGATDERASGGATTKKPHGKTAARRMEDVREVDSKAPASLSKGAAAELVPKAAPGCGARDVSTKDTPGTYTERASGGATTKKPHGKKAARRMEDVRDVDSKAPASPSKGVVAELVVPEESARAGAREERASRGANEKKPQAKKSSQPKVEVGEAKLKAPASPSKGDAAELVVPEGAPGCGARDASTKDTAGAMDLRASKGAMPKRQSDKKAAQPKADAGEVGSKASASNYMGSAASNVVVPEQPDDAAGGGTSSKGAKKKKAHAKKATQPKENACEVEPKPPASLSKGVAATDRVEKATTSASAKSDIVADTKGTKKEKKPRTQDETKAPAAAKTHVVPAKTKAPATKRGDTDAKDAQTKEKAAPKVIAETNEDVASDSIPTSGATRNLSKAAKKKQKKQRDKLKKQHQQQEQQRAAEAGTAPGVDSVSAKDEAVVGNTTSSVKARPANDTASTKDEAAYAGAPKANGATRSAIEASKPKMQSEKQPSHRRDTVSTKGDAADAGVPAPVPPLAEGEKKARRTKRTKQQQLEEAGLGDPAPAVDNDGAAIAAEARAAAKQKSTSAAIQAEIDDLEDDLKEPHLSKHQKKKLKAKLKKLKEKQGTMGVDAVEGATPKEDASLEEESQPKEQAKEPSSAKNGSSSGLQRLSVDTNVDSVEPKENKPSSNASAAHGKDNVRDSGSPTTVADVDAAVQPKPEKADVAALDRVIDGAPKEESEKERTNRLLQEAREKSAAAKAKKKSKKSKKHDKWLQEQEAKKTKRRKEWQGKIDEESEGVHLVSQLVASELLRQNKGNTKLSALSRAQVLENSQAAEAIEAESKRAHTALFGGLSCRVKVAGLDSKKDLNGRQGTLRYWDADKGLFSVGLDTKKGADSDVQLFMPENLEAISSQRRPGKGDKKPTGGYSVVHISISDLCLAEGKSIGCHFTLDQSMIASLRSAKSIDDELEAFSLARDEEERQRRIQAEKERKQQEKERRQEEEDRSRRMKQKKEAKAEKEKKREEWRRKRAERQERQRKKDEEAWAKIEAQREAARRAMLKGAMKEIEELKREMEKSMMRRHFARFMIEVLEEGGNPRDYLDSFMEQCEEKLDYEFDADDIDMIEECLLDYEEKEREFRKHLAEEKREKDGEMAQVLGVEPDVDERTLKLTYRKLALKYHPDKWRADSEHGMTKHEAQEHFKMIQNAYDHLMSRFDEVDSDDESYD